MTETDIPGSPEWKKSPFGVERRRKGRHGEEIWEIMVTAMLPFTSNNLREETRSFDTGEKRVLSTFCDINGHIKYHDDEISLLNPDQKSSTKICLLPDGDLVVFSMKSETDIRELAETNSDRSLAKMQYNPNGDVRVGIFQAERAFNTLDSVDADSNFSEDEDTELSVFQQILAITSFKEKMFDWKEIQVNSTETEGLVQEIVREGTCGYGKEILIQENKFILKRNGDAISVVCFSANGKERWTAKFPLKVDMKKIKAIFDDPESDFRPLRGILPIELKMNE